jgi:hypothetical protein
MSGIFRPFGTTRRRFTWTNFVMIEGDQARVLRLRHPVGDLPTKLQDTQTGRFYFPTGMRDGIGRPIYRMEAPVNGDGRTS